MPNLELQLLEEFCATYVAVGVTVDDVVEQGGSANLSLSHRGHAHMPIK